MPLRTSLRRWLNWRDMPANGPMRAMADIGCDMAEHVTGSAWCCADLQTSCKTRKQPVETFTERPDTPKQQSTDDFRLGDLPWGSRAGFYASQVSAD